MNVFSSESAGATKKDYVKNKIVNVIIIVEWDFFSEVAGEPIETKPPIKLRIFTTRGTSQIVSGTEESADESTMPLHLCWTRRTRKRKW